MTAWLSPWTCVAWDIGLSCSWSNEVSAKYYPTQRGTAALVCLLRLCCPRRAASTAPSHIRQTPPIGVRHTAGIQQDGCAADSTGTPEIRRSFGTEIRRKNKKNAAGHRERLKTDSTREHLKLGTRLEPKNRRKKKENAARHRARFLVRLSRE